MLKIASNNWDYTLAYNKYTINNRVQIIAMDWNKFILRQQINQEKDFEMECEVGVINHPPINGHPSKGGDGFTGCWFGIELL